LDLNEILNWFTKKGIKLNVSKTKHLRITFKNVNLKKYTINNVEIETVDRHKHLGVIIDNKLSFNEHIESLVNKALQKLSMLKRLCSSADSKTFLRLYKTYILPILENCNLAYYTNITNSNRLESVQKKVSSFICRKLGYYELNYEERLKLLKLNTLKNR